MLANPNLNSLVLNLRPQMLNPKAYIPCLLLLQGLLTVEKKGKKLGRMRVVVMLLLGGGGGGIIPIVKNHGVREMLHEDHLGEYWI